MWIIYSIPILPILIIFVALFSEAASFVRGCLPVLAGLLILKNVYVDLYCGIRKELNNPADAIVQFLLGIVRVAVIVPIINGLLTWSGGLLGLIGWIFTVILLLPIISMLWLLGELSSFLYAIGADWSKGKAIAGNIISVVCILIIYFVFL